MMLTSGQPEALTVVVADVGVVDVEVSTKRDFHVLIKNGHLR